MVIITNGTLMSIQNMTWNGKLGMTHKDKVELEDTHLDLSGFHSRPSQPIYITTPDYQYAAVYENKENKQDGYGSYGDKPQGTVGIQH